MTTTNTSIGLRSSVIRSKQESAEAKCAQECEWIPLPDTARCKYVGLHYIAMDEISERPAAAGKNAIKFTFRDILSGLWEILFPDHGRETYRQLEGDDITPITVYKSRNRYIVTDGGNSLAKARLLGQAYILAQVWELP